MDVDLDVYVPSAAGHDYEGYLAAGPAQPDADKHADVGLSLSDDLLNRVLFEAWRGGVLDMRLSTDDGSLEPIMLTQLKATEGTITLNPALPPVVVQKDGKLQAQFGELNVSIDTPDGQLGHHLDASIAMFVDLDMTVEDGQIKLSLENPELTITVRDSDWGADNETVTNLLQNMLPVDAMLSLLGDFSFPLPTVGGIAVHGATVSRESSGVYTGVAVTLQ